MSFVVSKKELDTYYGLGVRRFENAEMIGAVFLTKPEIVKRLLPPPLEPADMPSGLMFVAKYQKTNLGPGYNEAALFLNCKYKGELGSYCLSMPIDNEARMHNGRDIFGFPKKLAKIKFKDHGDRIEGTVERNGELVLNLEVVPKEKMDGLPPTGRTFLFKGMPRADLKPGFDGPVFLVGQKTEIEPKTVRTGMANIFMGGSDADPWGEVEIEGLVMAFHLKSNNTMLPGQVLEEVDGKAYLPYYFKMTDFSTGK